MVCTSPFLLWLECMKKILLAMYNVVVVVTLDKTRNSLFLFDCQAMSNFVTFIDYLNY